MPLSVLLVYGWYGRGNFGDELMAQALNELFLGTGYELKVVDHLDAENLRACEGVIMGGGSILHDSPNVTPEALQTLLDRLIPTFYLGIGMETTIHPVHRQILSISEVIATRSWSVPDWVRAPFYVPDLVNLLTPAEPLTAHEDSVLVVPNVEMVPTWQSPHWMHLAWDRWKDELAQYLDELVTEGTRLSFLSMCKNSTMDDDWPATEIIARMTRRNVECPRLRLVHNTFVITSEMRRHRLIISQRYHGAVLAAMARVPCVVVDHHDKLRDLHPINHVTVKYHGVTKAVIREAANLAPSALSTVDQKSVKASYEEAIRTVIQVLNRRKVC